MDATAFINQYGPVANSVAQRTGLDPSVVLGQIAQETGFGDHIYQNNIFGISPGGQVAGYPDVQTAADHYTNLINSRYSQAAKYGDPNVQANLIARGGYNPSPSYGLKVSHLAKNLTNAGFNAPSADTINSEIDNLTASPPAVVHSPSADDLTNELDRDFPVEAIPAKPEAAKSKGFMANVGAGLSGAVENIGNVISDPLTNLVEKPLAVAGGTAYDLGAHATGLYKPMSDEFRNKLYSNPEAAVFNLTPEQMANDATYAQPQLGSYLVNKLGQTGFPTPENTPPTSTGERLLQKGVSMGLTAAALGPEGFAPRMLAAGMGAGGAVVGDVAAHNVDPWLAPGAEMASNVLGTFSQVPTRLLDMGKKADRADLIAANAATKANANAASSAWSPVDPVSGVAARFTMTQNPNGEWVTQYTPTPPDVTGAVIRINPNTGAPEAFSNPGAALPKGTAPSPQVVYDTPNPEQMQSALPVGAAVTPQAQAAFADIAEARATRHAGEEYLLNEAQPKVDTSSHVPGVDVPYAQIEGTATAAQTQKALESLSPENKQAFTDLNNRNNAARVDHLSDVAGTPVTKLRDEQTRDANAQANLTATFGPSSPSAYIQPVIDAVWAIKESRAGQLSGVQVAMNKILQHFDPKSKFGDAGLVTLSTDPEGFLPFRMRPEHLYGVRQEISNMMTPSMQGEMTGTSIARKQLMSVRDVVDNAINQATKTVTRDPTTGAVTSVSFPYETYLRQYRQDSIPINTANVLQGYLQGGKLLDANGNLTFNRYHKMMQDIVADRGSPDGTADAKSIPDGAMEKLWDLHSDLRRQQTSDNLARARGSDTVQLLGLQNRLANIGNNPIVKYPAALVSGAANFHFGGPSEFYLGALGLPKAMSMVKNDLMQNRLNSLMEQYLSNHPQYEGQQFGPKPQKTTVKPPISGP